MQATKCLRNEKTVNRHSNGRNARLSGQLRSVSRASIESASPGPT